MSDYNFAYLDEQTKRMIRRAILKGLAIPGYQVPFASREMPMPYGWGTGGVQVAAASLVPEDVLQVIDQGADDTTNAVSIRRFFSRTANISTTERTTEATIIQTRHRVPETPFPNRARRWSATWGYGRARSVSRGATDAPRRCGAVRVGHRRRDLEGGCPAAGILDNGRYSRGAEVTAARVPVTAERGPEPRSVVLTPVQPFRWPHRSHRCTD